MSNKTFKTILVLGIIAVFTFCVCLFCSQTLFAVSAEEQGAEIVVEGDGNAPTTPETPTVEETPDSGTGTVSDSVRAYLQSIYGDDYEQYYNQIVDNWGSVEKFLLNASENLPDEYRYKATELITTVNAYIGVAADGVLLICVGIYIACRVKKNRKLNADLTTLKACDNQIEVAQLAIIKSQKAQSAALQKLMPGAKFEDEVAELIEADKSLDGATEEVNKIV